MPARTAPLNRPTLGGMADGTVSKQEPPVSLVAGLAQVCQIFLKEILGAGVRLNVNQQKKFTCSSRVCGLLYAPGRLGKLDVAWVQPTAISAACAKPRELQQEHKAVDSATTE